MPGKLHRYKSGLCMHIISTSKELITFYCDYTNDSNSIFACMHTVAKILASVYGSCTVSRPSLSAVQHQ